jgi:transcriptional regulator
VKAQNLNIHSTSSTRHQKITMYIPQPFAERRTEALQRIIEENALGMLVTHTATGLEVQHLPFLSETVEGHGMVLTAHVARANPIWREVGQGDKVLVVFRGAQGYISPSWYPGKHQTHRRVPTWNYEVVHAHGTVHVHDDENFLRGVVARLTRQHEASQAQPWKMGDAPADYLAEQLRHIVGLEVRVERLEGKRKLNQHHTEQDREGAIRGLRENGDHDLAQAMANAGHP